MSEFVSTNHKSTTLREKRGDFALATPNASDQSKDGLLLSSVQRSSTNSRANVEVEKRSRPECIEPTENSARPLIRALQYVFRDEPSRSLLVRGDSEFYVTEVSLHFGP